MKQMNTETLRPDNCAYLNALLDITKCRSLPLCHGFGYWVDFASGARVQRHVVQLITQRHNRDLEGGPRHRKVLMGKGVSNLGVKSRAVTHREVERISLNDTMSILLVYSSRAWKNI